MFINTDAPTPRHIQRLRPGPARHTKGLQHWEVDGARLTHLVLSRGSLLPTHLSQEHSCVISIGVGKNLDMLNTLINFLDPVFAEHLSEWPPLLPYTSLNPREGVGGGRDPVQGSSSQAWGRK